MSTAGWHTDPKGEHELRYFDGAQWTEHVTDHGAMSTDGVAPAAQKAALDAELAKLTAGGWRLVLRESDTEAVVERGKRPNHLLHLILSLVTLGIWGIFVWLPLAVFMSVKHRRITVDEHGAVRHHR